MFGVIINAINESIDGADSSVTEIERRVITSDASGYLQILRQ